MQTPHHLARMSTPVQRLRIRRNGTQADYPWRVSCPDCGSLTLGLSNWRAALFIAGNHIRAHLRVLEALS